MKEKILIIEAEGRDKGKAFQLKEVSAMQAEKWAYRAIQGAMKAGMDVPPNIAKQGAAAVMYFGVQALACMPWSDAEPLLDEMMGCVKIIRDRKHPEMSFPMIETDIEEVATLFQLRQEVFNLHANFSAPGAPSTSTSEAPESTSSNTPTSHPRSVRPSPREKPRL